MGNNKSAKTGCGILILIVFIIYLVTMLFPSRFEEIGYYKSNKQRVYSVYVNNFTGSTADFGEMFKHAQSKMYTEGGSTIVFFFNNKSNTPNVSLTGANFSKQYEPNCVAAYWKYPNGKEDYAHYPFNR